MDAEDAEEVNVPDHILPLFFTSKTQEIFECKVDEQVTEESPFKIITKEQIFQDFRDRAAISDFHPAKKIVEKYTSDELLVVYDPLFLYGQNFYLVTDEEQKNRLLNPPQPEPDEELLSEDVAVEIRYGLRTPRPWVSWGSEQDVMDESVIDTREKLEFTICKPREMFGSPILLDDRDEENLKDVFVDCISYEDDSLSVETKELDKAIQHVSAVATSHSQTEWPCPRNANVQYESRSNDEEINDSIMKSDDIINFISEVIPRFELALQQNDTFNLFVNDYFNLGEEDSMFGSKSDNHLKEYQSFTDLQFSKNKTISDIQWHPRIKGLIAVSCIEHMSFYERIDRMSHNLMTHSLILIWSFADPIHPLLLLEAPDDIMCFKFNPSDPNIICGGCINGQVVLWDISKYNDHLENHRTHGQGSQTNQNLSSLPSFFHTAAKEISPIMRYCAVSSIEYSHRMAVTDIQWIPDHMEIGKMGVVFENKSSYCSQIITCASDGSVLFWDTNSSKSATVIQNTDDTVNDRPSTFQHLDLAWKPILKVTVHRLKGSGDYSPVKFSISEVQNTAKQPAFKEDVPSEPVQEELQMSGISFKKKDETKALDDVDTKFYVVTEDGELVYLDWKPTKDIDTAKIVSSRPEFCTDAHDTVITTLQRSPFLRDIFLTVGGWTFSIWKHGVTVGPLFQSYSHSHKLTSGHWSPSRPGVFFIGKSDGSVDVWDLLDKSHEPFLTQSVTPVSVVSVFPHQISSKQQFLAAGDEVGTLHIMEVPWNLRTASTNELSIVEHYLEREANRLMYVDNRQTSRPVVKTKDSNATEAEEKPIMTQSDEEWEAKAKLEYLDFLEMEKRLLEELGYSNEME